jgi:hypothetical protein
MISRHAVHQVVALSFFMGCAAAPIARAAPLAPPAPALSAEAQTAVARLGQTLSTPALSFTAKTIRMYLDESGQPLHIFHTLKVLARRPNRLAAQVSGDDGAHDLFYDGETVSVFSPDRKEYAVLAAPGDIHSALTEVLAKLNVDFPLVDFFSATPDQALVRGVLAGWQVGTARVGGVECQHLFFSRRAGIELELWVENTSVAIPHRLVVTYRLLPGQPSFIAEFTEWHTGVQPANTAFVFHPPADAKKVELGPAVTPGKEGSEE